jgi:hypothetical protein
MPDHGGPKTIAGVGLKIRTSGGAVRYVWTLCDATITRVFLVPEDDGYHKMPADGLCNLLVIGFVVVPVSLLPTLLPLIAVRRRRITNTPFHFHAQAEHVNETGWWTIVYNWGFLASLDLMRAEERVGGSTAT